MSTAILLILMTMKEPSVFVTIEMEVGMILQPMVVSVKDLV